jgi:RNA polymerase sigma-70 factor (ECF subfamily)
MAENGFDAFYAAQFRRLTSQLCAYLGDLAEAQDVVQEAFTRAWPRWETISQYDDPAGWVRRVAWNLATSRWRRLRTAAQFAAQQRQQVVPDLSPGWVDVCRALANLPQHHRRAVVLHYFAGLSVAEIALECQVAQNTVKSWLHRGRAALSGVLGVSEEVTDAIP